MSEHFEHNPGDHEDPLPGPTWLISLVGVALLNVVFLGVAALYFSAHEEEDKDKRLMAEPIDLETLNLGQLAQLEGEPTWWITKVDNRVESRRLSIPIELAMEKMAEESGR